MNNYQLSMLSNKNNYQLSMLSNKNNTKHDKYSLEEYIEKLQNKCEKKIVWDKSLEKVNSETLIVPTIENYSILTSYKYNMQQLKYFAKKYKLKISGNKNELVIRLYSYLCLSKSIIKIQKVFRGLLQRRFNICHGPAFMNKKLCTNPTDFLTMEDLSEIPYSQFVSFKDADGFIYGFDMISLYNLINKTDKKSIIKNPYNRNEISINVIQNMRNIIRLGRILGISIDTEIKEIQPVMMPERNIKMRVFELFQNIDSLGNYSDPMWLLSLDKRGLVKFMRELTDIWNYRAQLTQEVKRNIYPPHGEPFYALQFNVLYNEENPDTIRKMILPFLEKLIKSGIDTDSKSLGAFYILGALTLVNTNAATSLPWLYQSFLVT
jgi:hypothetical protein